jgi:hypothetical protein
MKRITMSLPDNVESALRREARRRRVPVSTVAREAIETRLGLRATGKREIPFAGIGRSGHGSIARDMEEILADEWGRAGDR